jgi:hypothetical protein
MSRITLIAAAVWFLQASLQVGDGTDDRLAIRLHLSHTTVETGTPIEVAIEFLNVGDTAFYLNRTFDLGADAIEIVASRGECRYSVEPVHFDMDASARESMFTKLLPGDRLIQGPFRLSDPEGLSDRLIPGPGTYTVQATFHSEGPLTYRESNPVWRGTVKSSEGRLRISPPTISSLERWRGLLQASLKTGEPDSIALNYFRLVRDPVAADLLVNLLKQHPENPFVVEAIANQQRPGDASILDGIAQAVGRTGDSKSPEYLRTLAARLRNPGRCDFP